MRRRMKKWVLFILAVSLLLMGTTISVLADDSRTEQIYVNKPEVVVYYRNVQGKVKAWLGGEELEFKEKQKFSETGEPIHYFILEDISGSINDTRFKDIRNSLISFLQDMREKDKMLLYTFGDKVTPVLTGDEDRETAVKKIAEMENHDQNTVLFDAIEQAADLISEAAQGEQKKWALVIISDGEDYADNTKTVQSTTERLTDLGIPAYTIAVENDMGYSEQILSQYQANFSSVASQTGGIAWTPGKKDTLCRSVREALDQIQNSVLEGYRAKFQSSSNRLSNQKEQFVLEFEDKKTEIRNVLVNRNQPDQEPPTVSIQEKTENAFQAVYSEPVEGAGLTGNYRVTLDGKNVEIDQVVRDESQENSYLIIMKKALKNLPYHITVSNVTDASEERNRLSTGKLEVKVTSQQEADQKAPEVKKVEQSGTEGFLVTFSEAVQNADNNGNYTVTLGGKIVAVQQVIPYDEKENTYRLLLNNGLKNGTYSICIGGTIRDASSEENVLKETEQKVIVNDIGLTGKSVLNFILRWWPVVLTVLVLILLFFVIVYMKKIRKKNITVVDGELIEPGDIERKVHVGMLQNSGEGQKKNVVLWLANGKDEPKRIDFTINGSCFIGRSEKLCEIYCDDPMMSKQHFNLSVEADGTVQVTDLDSTNGTAVNGVRIQRSRKLNSGDEISAGNIRFIIEW